CSVHHIIILCLTNTNVNHIQLHPFPTRRSSDLSLRSKAPKYHPALRHRRTISPRNGADSWHLSRRRESTCFPRTPEVTPHRVSRAPTRPRELNVFLGDVGKREEANLAFAPELRQRLIY